MSETQNDQKILEVKIRSLPNQERQDQRDVSRVFISKDALLDLRLEAGQLCYLWKIEDVEARRRQAIAWPTTQKLNKNVIQMFRTFQDVCGFRLEDKIALAPAEDIQSAECVILRDITGIGSLKERDMPHWEWYLEDKLGRAENIFTGMTFEVSLKGPKRSFVVESFVNNEETLPCTMVRFGGESSVKIVSEENFPASDILDGARPRLQIPNIDGIERALTKLNEFLADFDDDQTTEPAWGQRSRGVLLHGTHGTGKSLILKKISNTGWGKVFNINRPIKSSDIRQVFKNAKQVRSSIIVIDDIDSIVSKENGSSDDVCRALGEEMDSLVIDNLSVAHKVVIVATASVPNEVPRSLRKRGRFTAEIALPLPDADARKRILKALAPATSTEGQLTLLDRLGDRTHAYTAEDLGLLLDEACRLARRRCRAARFEGTEVDQSLLQQDIDEALLTVRPSAMYDVALQPPKVKWNDIGGQGNIKKALRRAVEIPLLYPDLVRRLGATQKKGLLLYGPPGCSKTLSAQAMATEIGFNFFAVKGAELLNMYVGESERAVRDIFARARAASPSIIFFDEIESIGSKRESGGRNNGVNVLTTLLNEMDGIETLKGVTILAATNKPEALDLALLRPGRFDDLLYVAPPDRVGREEILRVQKRKMDWADDVDILRLSQLTDGYSGAEVVAICRAACDMVIDRSLDTGNMNLQVQMEDFVDAIKLVKRQITPEMISRYKEWASRVGSAS